MARPKTKPSETFDQSFERGIQWAMSNCDIVKQSFERKELLFKMLIAELNNLMKERYLQLPALKNTTVIRKKKCPRPSAPLDRNHKLLDSFKVQIVNDGIEVSCNQYYVYNWAKFNMLPLNLVWDTITKVTKKFLETIVESIEKGAPI